MSGEQTKSWLVKIQLMREMAETELSEQTTGAVNFQWSDALMRAGCDAVKAIGALSEPREPADIPKFIADLVREARAVNFTSEYMEVENLKSAARILRSAGWSVEKIAEAVGYSDAPRTVGVNAEATSNAPPPPAGRTPVYLPQVCWDGHPKARIEKQSGYTTAEIRELRPEWDEAKVQTYVGKPLLGGLPK